MIGVDCIYCGMLCYSNEEECDYCGKDNPFYTGGVSYGCEDDHTSYFDDDEDD